MIDTDSLARSHDILQICRPGLGSMQWSNSLHPAYKIEPYLSLTTSACLWMT